MTRGILICLMMVSCCAALSQRSDTVRRYLNDRLALTTKNKAAYAAISIWSDDHWMLYAVYPDTGVLLKAYFKDRDLKIKDGPFVLYHRKGIKAMEGVFVKNIRQGLWRYWYPGGVMRDSGAIKNNQMAGTWRSFYETGELQAVANYLPMDSVKGEPVVSAYFDAPNTGLLEGDTIVNYPHGAWYSYYANGQIKDSGSYVHGRQQGLWKTWYESGVLSSVGHYTDGTMADEWEFFYENGKPSTKETYKNNKVAAMQCFDSTGALTGDFCSIMKPAVPKLDRFTSFQSYLLEHIVWPPELNGKDVNGIVTAEYSISKTGELLSVKITRSPHELLGREVERFLRSIEKWWPAYSHNRPVAYNGILEVPFIR